MASLILKGEIHTSSADLDEERELLKNGVDVVVFEGAESDPEYRLYESWFDVMVLLFNATVGHIYQDKTILSDLAEVQNIPIRFTRESNADLLRNTPVVVHLFAALLFYALIFISIILGTITGNLVTGSLYLLGAVSIPLILIRGYNTILGKGSKNRDAIIANKITDATGEHETVLAIVGAAHVSGIRKRLPDELDVEYKPPKYGLISLRHGRDVLGPAFTGFSELFVIYLLIFYTTHTFVI
jgi:hypothetical protein